MAFRYKITRVAGLLLLTATLAGAQPIYSNQLPTDIDRFVRQIMDSANVPGLSLAVVRNHALQFSRGYGLTRADSTQPVTTATVFDAASLSKPVFAYAVLQLVDEKRLDLDKPLYEYLPYPDVAADDRYKKITARLVLSHRSGFPNWRRNRQSNQLALAFTPGERFGYSGEGFVYLQKVVEKLTGQSTNEFMIERVFRPLRMDHSSYVWQPAFDADFALPHTSFGQPTQKGKPRQANVAYSLQTTADDFARFVLAIVAGQGLQKSTIDQMLSPQTQLPSRFGRPDSLSSTLFWGLGLGLEQTSTGHYAWHWGDNGTYKGYIVADRQRGNAVVFFANGFNGLTLVDALTRRFVGGQHPAVAFLGYGSYWEADRMFARYVLDKGVSGAIKPYLNHGKSTLSQEGMNQVGEQLMDIGRLTEALAVFRYNLDAYPNSADALDGYGFALLQNGQSAEAIPYLTKSLAIKPANERTKKTLAGLTDAQTGRGNTKLTLANMPAARLITLAGSFNDWEDYQLFFVKKGDVWHCSLDLKPGTYSYKIIVDGKWMTDPGNPATQKDEQGNLNSVLVVN